MQTQSTVFLAVLMLAVGAGGAMVYNHYQAPDASQASFKTQSLDMAEFARKGWIPDGEAEYKQQQRIQEGDPIREVREEVPTDTVPTEPTPYTPDQIKEVYSSLSPEDQAGLDLNNACRVVECPGGKEL